MDIEDLDPVWRTDQSSSAELLESGLFADAEIRLGERTWKVHKNIVCVQSKYFKAALTGGFKEAEDGVVILDEKQWTEGHISCLLSFLYTGTIHVEKCFPNDKKERYVTLMKVYVVGDYFQVAKLLELVTNTQETYTQKLGRDLCDLGSYGNPQGTANSIIKAISILHEIYPKREDLIRQLQPDLLRLILCGAQFFQVSQLCMDFPRFFEDWKEFLKDKESAYREWAAPDENCADCAEWGAAYRNFLRSFMAEDSSTCVDCHTLPTLVHWEKFRQIHTLEKERASLTKRLAKAQQDLQEALRFCL